MDEHTLLWAMLPKGLEPYFEIEGFKEDNEILKIVLLEKNIVPEELGEKYHGKKIINTVIKPITVDYFPDRLTNASAESFNSKLKGFRSLVRGIRDINFFLFRIHTFYS